MNSLSEFLWGGSKKLGRWVIILKAKLQYFQAANFIQNQPTGAILNIRYVFEKFPSLTHEDMTELLKNLEAEEIISVSFGTIYKK